MGDALRQHVASVRLKPLTLLLIACVLLAGLLVVSLWRAPAWIKDFLISELHAAGITVTYMDEPRLSFSGAVFDRVTLRYDSNTLNANINVESLRTSIDWEHKRIAAIAIDALNAQLEIRPSNTPAPWPAFTLPLLPLDKITIGKASVALINQDSSMAWQGAVTFSPEKTKWYLTLTNAHHRVALSTTAPAPHFIELDLQDDTQKQIKIALRLAHGLAPLSEVELNAEVNLAFNGLAELFPPSFNTALHGSLSVNGSVRLGEHGGEWHEALFSVGSDTLHVTQNNIEASAAIDIKIVANPSNAELVLEPTTNAIIQKHGLADVSAIRLALPAPLNVRFPMERNGKITPYINGLIETTFSYQTIAVTTQTALDHLIDLDNDLHLPVNISLNADHLLFGGVTLSHINGKGQSLVTIGNSSSIRLDKPLPFRWKKMRYQSMMVEEGLAHITGSMHLSTAPDGSNSSFTVESEQWRIKDGETLYSLIKPSAKLVQKQNAVALHLDANKAHMTDNGDTQTINQLRVQSSAPNIATLSKAISITGKDLSHPLLKDWPNPDINMIAGENVPGVWNAKGSLLLQNKPLLEFDLTHRLSLNEGAGKLHWQWPLTDLQRMLTKKPKAIAPLALMSGDSQGDFDAAWRKKDGAWQFQLRGDTKTNDGAIVWQESSGSGLNLHGRLDDMQNLHGKIDAKLSAFALAAGINATDLSAEIEKTQETLSVNNVFWRLLDAEWYVPNQTYHTGDELHAPMAIIGLNLEKLLKLFDVYGLTGQGQLDGAIPITLKDAGVIMENAELHARYPGTLSYTPGAPNPHENIGLKVLRDFHYKTLRVQFNYRTEGDYTIKLTLHGSNPSFYDGYPINLSLNIAGKLPGMFKSALFSGDFNKHILESVGAGTTPLN